MKFRIRFGSSRSFVEIQPGADATLQDLQTKVAEKYSISKTSFELSLNGKDAIAGDDQTLLRSTGIVDGDLVHIVLKESVGESSSGDDNTLASADRHFLAQMVDMGFAKDDAAQALVSSGNVSIHTALEVLLQQQQQQQQQQDSSAAKSEQPSVSGKNTEVEQSGREDYEQQKPCFQVLKPRTILCREGIPDTLHEVYCSASVTNLHEAVLVVVHVLMLETGYLLLPDDSDASMTAAPGASCSLTLLPANWNKSSVKKFCYTHPACPNVHFSITCTSLGPYVLVHGLTDSTQSSNIFQSKLLATDFVRGTTDLTQQGASSVYRNLHRLSLIIKDKIAYPLLSFARSELGLPELFGFMALPAEVKLMTLRCLPVESVLHVACTCRELHVLTSDPCLWQFLCYRDFGITTRGKSQSWRTEYKRRYEEKKCEERARQFVGMPPYPHIMDPSTFVPHSPNFPPGIIGGRSDLFPDMPYMPGGLAPFPSNARVPRPRFDPFGPTSDSDNWSRPGRGRGPNARGFPGFHPGFM